LSPGSDESFFSPKCPPGMWPTELPMQLVWWLKRPGREGDGPLQSRAEGKNE
jgi:hypothetical protein